MGSGGDLKLGVAILTGGASSRMGADKAAMDWLGVRAVDRVARLGEALGGKALLTIGRTGYGLPFLADQVPFGGPVGGIVAGVAALAAQGCDLALVLAVDAPTVRPQDLEPLIGKGRPGAAYEGYHLPLTLDPQRLPRDAEVGWPVARLIEASGLARLPCPSTATGRIRGANTPEERAALLAELRAYEAASAG